MYMLVAFLALLAFLGGFGGKSAKNVECAKEGVELIKTIQELFSDCYHFVKLLQKWTIFKTFASYLFSHYFWEDIGLI